MITQDTMDAAEESFGSFPQPEPYIGMRFKLGAVYISWTPTHDKVWQVYKVDKSVVNDDADLFAAIAEPLWDYSASLKENLRRLPRDSNITRRRRELHQAGYIEYSKQADKRRSKAMVNEIDLHSTSPTVKIVKGEKVVTPPEKWSFGTKWVWGQKEIAELTNEQQATREQQGLF